MKTPTAVVALAGAIAFGAGWPWFAQHGARATGIPVAPISTDYGSRDRLIAFYERQARLDPTDQITQRMLAGEYLQRFRETGDLTDVSRARATADRSLRLQPQGNVQALGVIASSDVAFHRFLEALAAERASLRAAPFDDNARAQIGSILMELGRYDQANLILAHPTQRDPNPTW
ncbi:MAG: tetratricopeptide repeat protein, partial [Candidatus Baltobacteraceae bacterium]